MKSTFGNSGDTTSRSGEEHRTNPDRFFHVMTQGWYLFTREGIRGPFDDRSEAEVFLNRLLIDLRGQTDPAASWRL